MFRRFLPVRRRKTASLFSPNPSSAENLANLAGADDRDSADDQDFQYHLASADDLESRHKQTAKTTRKTPNNNNSVHTKRLSSTRPIGRIIDMTANGSYDMVGEYLFWVINILTGNPVGSRCVVTRVSRTLLTCNAYSIVVTESLSPILRRSIRDVSYDEPVSVCVIRRNHLKRRPSSCPVCFQLFQKIVRK